MLVTREQFSRKFLDRLDAPHTQRNIWALLSWMQAEGGTARFNPLNTTMPMPGATNYNWVGVKNYRTLDQGLDATVRTILLDHFNYPKIVRCFRRNAWARWTLTAVENSDWGTGGLALDCLHWVKRNTDQYATRPIGQ